MFANMKNAYLHPKMAENSLPVEIDPAEAEKEMTYHILSRTGQLLRKGCFKSTLIYISTCMLPKGEQFLLRIHHEGQLLHEGAFQTLH